MKTWIEFNMNQYVRVRLTEYGRSLHRQDYDEFVRRFGKPPFKYKPPVEDADGWSEWQLWQLMNIFGQHVQMGFRVPFETNMKFAVEKELPNG